MLLAYSSDMYSHPKHTLKWGKFSLEIVVVLLILIPGALLSSLRLINPWLSACDVSDPLEPELQGTCHSIPYQSYKRMNPKSDGMYACPKPCPIVGPHDSKCLAYLDDSRKNAICNFSSGTGSAWLKTFLAQIRLRHCCEYRIIETLSGPLLDRVIKGKEDCFRVIDSLEDVDNIAARITCEFAQILSRFDCSHDYSMHYGCEDCKEAYRKWVCSTLIPYFNGTKQIRPCRTYCEIVEQKCPYFLPENRAPWLPTQYAGEPAFLCVDPNIPETEEQQARSLYATENTCCVQPCGRPREGNCIRQGQQCQDPTIFYNISEQQCEPVDPNLLRPPNGKCAGPSVYPGQMYSTVSATTSNPVLIFVLLFLAIQASNRPRRHNVFLFFYLFFILGAIVYLYSCSHGIVRLPAGSCLISITLILSFIGTNLYYCLMKLSQVLFRRIKFYIHKWKPYRKIIRRYLRTDYFAKIWNYLRSVKNPFSRTPPPKPPPVRNRPSRVRREKIRGHCSSHGMKILSKAAQRLMKKKLDAAGEGGFLRKRKTAFDYLLLETLTANESNRSTKCFCCNTYSMKIHTIMIPPVLLIEALPAWFTIRSEKASHTFVEKFMKTNYCRCCFDISLLLILICENYSKTSVLYKAIRMFLNNSRYSKLMYYYLKKHNGNKRFGKSAKNKRSAVPVRKTAARGLTFSITDIKM